VKQVNWGIIGLGAIATQFANGFEFVKNAKLLGIASNNQNKIKEFREKYKRREQCKESGRQHAV